MIQTNQWYKSSYSQTEIQACVEVRTDTSMLEVRDSKDVSIPSISFPVDSWDSFVKYVS